MRTLLSLTTCLLLGCAGPARDAHQAHRDHRDAHGPPRVATYIEHLESSERIAQLRPEEVVQRLALHADAWVGDVGCGPGVFSLAFAHACPEGVVLAADIEPAQLDRLAVHLREDDVRNVIPVLASADDAHFPPGRMDLVFIADTLHHLPRPAEYLRELGESLKLGGRLAVLELKPGELPVGPPPERKLAPGELERLLGEAGYERVERFDTHPWHDFEVWRPRNQW